MRLYACYMERRLLFNLSQAGHLWVTVMLSKTFDEIRDVDPDYGPKYFKAATEFEHVLNRSGVPNNLIEQIAEDFIIACQVAGGKHLGSVIDVSPEELAALGFGPFQIQVVP